jgi:hypothetical protein
MASLDKSKAGYISHIRIDIIDVYTSYFFLLCSELPLWEVKNMCQLVLSCPEAQTFFRYAFPFLIVLLLTAGALLVSEVIKTYMFMYPKQKIPTQQAIQMPYSLLAQAQKIAEKAEKQILEKEKRIPLRS